MSNSCACRFGLACGAMSWHTAHSTLLSLNLVASAKSISHQLLTPFKHCLFTKHGARGINVGYAHLYVQTSSAGDSPLHCRVSTQNEFVVPPPPQVLTCYSTVSCIRRTTCSEVVDGACMCCLCITRRVVDYYLPWFVEFILRCGKCRIRTPWHLTSGSIFFLHFLRASYLIY